MRTTCTLRCGHPVTNVSAEPDVTMSTLPRMLRPMHLRISVRARVRVRVRVRDRFGGDDP